MPGSDPVVAAFGGAIDVHAHYLPSAYRAALDANGVTHPDGIPFGLPSWDPQAHIGFMDSIGIATSVLSISSPGLLVSNDPADAIALASAVNDEGAELVRTHPDRFGLFASLPLPDVDASLREVGRAYDDLAADGISLLTNYAGVYLGDDRLDPLFAELNRRHALCALHPTSPACWEAVSFGRSRATVEFIIDTARAIANLSLSGTLSRYPNVRIVIPHTGGALSVLADRVHRSAQRAGDGPDEIDFIGDLRRQYFDLAGGPLPRLLPALLNLVDVSRILYGSDFPFSAAAATEAAASDIANCDLFSKDELQAVLRGTCLGLFPRLAP